ncbi:MAG: hypothetical protein MJ232_00045 [archaeon]|nr:hypothetical protein [archaeon]
MEKIIHYCWFGNGKKPRAIRKCIRSWKKYYPDWEIKEWNESNFDIENSCYYVKESYRIKKYAFVADYVRCYALYNFGGLYLDTDMKAIKKPTKEFLENNVLCMQGKGQMQCALIKCSKKTNLMKSLISQFESLDNFPIKEHLNSFLDAFAYKEIKSKPEDKNYNLGEFLLFDSSYFMPKRWNWDKSKFQTKDTLFIHLYIGSWKPANKNNFIKLQLFRFLCFVIGTKNAYTLKAKTKKLFGLK